MALCYAASQCKIGAHCLHSTSTFVCCVFAVPIKSCKRKRRNRKWKKNTPADKYWTIKRTKVKSMNTQMEIVAIIQIEIDTNNSKASVEYVNILALSIVVTVYTAWNCMLFASFSMNLYQHIFHFSSCAPFFSTLFACIGKFALNLVISPQPCNTYTLQMQMRKKYVCKHVESHSQFIHFYMQFIIHLFNKYNIETNCKQ